MRILVAEAVSEGHPDKIADQIADAILDELLQIDEFVRAGCEVLITGNSVVVSGEFGSAHDGLEIGLEGLVSRVVEEIGFDDDSYGLDHKKIEITRFNRRQSAVLGGIIEGGLPGDQGVVVGFACGETAEYLPLGYKLANSILKRCSEIRKSRENSWLRPDAKCLVTVEYDDSFKPVRVVDIVLSHQHSAVKIHDRMREFFKEEVINPILKAEGCLGGVINYFINTLGNFTKGGSGEDTGLTGRKLMADTYGCFAMHGGGALSGKDGSKVDRSGAYMARYVAKNLVAAGVCSRLQLTVGYRLGLIDPLFISVDTFGGGLALESRLVDFIKSKFDFTVDGMISKLDLRRPIYRQTSVYGHFMNPDFAWERLDCVDDIKAHF